MQQPPPPGWGAPPGAPPAAPPGSPPDPYAAQRALAEWAEAKSLTLSETPDISWYLGWQPFVYVAALARVGRELSQRFDDVSVAWVEAFESDPIKQAAGEDRHVMAFITSPHVRHRVAVRSKQGAGELTDLGRGIVSLFGGNTQAGAVLGDPAFEQQFDIRTPTREEGLAALPLALRQLLVTSGFRGAIETRAGGMVVQFYGLRFFDPAALEGPVALLPQVYRAAIG